MVKPAHDTPEAVLTAALLNHKHTGQFLRLRPNHLASLVLDPECAAAILAALTPGWCGHDWEEVTNEVIRYDAEIARLTAALKDAFKTMDAACRWAANETAGVRTVEDANRHMAGYDALVDGTARAGVAAGVLFPNALAASEPPPIHVYPVGEGHEMSEDCWCHPKVSGP